MLSAVAMFHHQQCISNTIWHQQEILHPWPWLSHSLRKRYWTLTSLVARVVPLVCTYLYTFKADMPDTFQFFYTIPWDLRCFCKVCEFFSFLSCHFCMIWKPYSINQADFANSFTLIGSHLYTRIPSTLMELFCDSLNIGVFIVKSRLLCTYGMKQIFLKHVISM